MKTYKIEYNHFGIIYVIAPSFSDAENTFLASLKTEDKETTTIKSISAQVEFREPLVFVK